MSDLDRRSRVERAVYEDGGAPLSADNDPVRTPLRHLDGSAGAHRNEVPPAARAEFTRNMNERARS